MAVSGSSFARFRPCLLACVAFVCWAIGTSAGVAALIGLDRVESGVVLGLAVFLIPLMDGVLNRLLRR